jgi:AbiV family abortive infection protein
LNKTKPDEKLKNIEKIKGKMKKHSKKHAFSALAGALVNNRIQRLFGKKQIDQFLHACDNGIIEKIRQNCIYSQVINNALITPRKCVSRDKALFYICLVGEIYAEIGGLASDQTWNKILNEAEKFEKKYGMPVAMGNYFQA